MASRDRSRWEEAAQRISPLTRVESFVQVACSSLQMVDMGCSALCSSHEGHCPTQQYTLQHLEWMEDQIVRFDVLLQQCASTLRVDDCQRSAEVHTGFMNTICSAVSVQAQID